MEETLEQKMYHGSRAKEVLDNDQFQLAFESTEKELTESWKNSKGSADDREKIFLQLQALTMVRQALESRLATGKLAALEVERRRSLADRVRGIWQ